MTLVDDHLNWLNRSLSKLAELVPLSYSQGRSAVYSDTFRVRQLVFVAYVHTPTFIGICMILDMRALTRMLIFSL